MQTFRQARHDPCLLIVAKPDLVLACKALRADLSHAKRMKIIVLGFGRVGIVTVAGLLREEHTVIGRRTRNPGRRSWNTRVAEPARSRHRSTPGPHRLFCDGKPSCGGLS